MSKMRIPSHWSRAKAGIRAEQRLGGMALAAILVAIVWPGAETGSLLAQGLTPATPARENIYSGGKLMAVEETAASLPTAPAI